MDALYLLPYLPCGPRVDGKRDDEGLKTAAGDEVVIVLGGDNNDGLLP